jgi:hypothetical protein
MLHTEKNIVKNSLKKTSILDNKLITLHNNLTNYHIRLSAMRINMHHKDQQAKGRQSNMV